MADKDGDIAAAIEAWFSSLNGDGDFLFTPQEIEVFSEGEVRSAASILYLTKPYCLSRLNLPENIQQPVAFIALPGLPGRDRLEEFENRSQLYFVGDADPVDLLIFAWLRTFMSIEYLGVSDKLLNQHGNLGTARIKIALSESELSTIPHLEEWCPDYRALLGEHCASILDGGFKIELEGAITKFD